MRRGTVLGALGASLIAGCACALSACATTAPATAAPAHSTRASREEVLRGLRLCLNLLDAGVPLQPSAACLHAPLTSLAGISRTELVQALGPAQWCYGLPLAFPDKGGDCGSAWNPGWDFLAHGRPFIGGGVRDLLCVAEHTGRCRQLEWSSAAH